MSEKHTDTDYDKRPIDPDMDDPYTKRGKTPEQIYRDAKHFSKRFAQEVTENRKLKRELGEARRMNAIFCEADDMREEAVSKFAQLRAVAEQEVKP